jgi:protein-S-isoprenylcysteine O-methyltransferase Ste14
VNSSPVGPRIFAWTGALLFAGSLLYFLFSYAITFGETMAGPLRAADVVVNAGLFAVFAVHHSVFARESMRARVARVLSPALERSVYIWAASLMLILVCLLWRPLPGVVWQVRGPTAWLLALVQLAGAWLSVRSAAIIDIWDLSGVRQAAGRPSGRPAPGVTEFKTEGPYGWVRHPIYLGWFLLVLAVPTMTMTRLAFALISCAYVLLAIPLEERSLRRTSSGAYEDYMRRVPWKLVPRVY